MSKRKHKQPSRELKPRLLAKWQRVLLWCAWGAFFGLCIWNSDRDYLSFREFGLLAIAVVVTIWSLTNPLGRERFEITEPASMRGDFASRTNWPMLICGFALTLGGLAGGMKIWHDLHYGFTTFAGVFEDFLLFFLEWTIEILSKGLTGDVTNTKMYTLVFLFPIGLMILIYNAMPLLFRGSPFRVTDKGELRVRWKGNWQLLQIGQFRKVTADGITIDFTEPIGNLTLLKLPQQRVFSVSYDTRVQSEIVGKFFRERLQNAGFAFESSVEAMDRQWTATNPKLT